MYSLKLDSEGRVLYATYPQFLPDGALTESLPEGNIRDWLFVSGEFILKPLPKEPETENPPATELERLKTELSQLKAQCNDNTLAVAELLGGSI